MIEKAITEWLGGLSAKLYPLIVPEGNNVPAILYRIESQFTPEDEHGPYGAEGDRVRFSIWDKGYKSASELKDEVIAVLEEAHPGYLISIEDRGDLYDKDSGVCGIIIDAEVTTLQTIAEGEQSGIREAARVALTGNTTAGPNVFATRLGFANCDSFPCIGVRIDDTQIESDNGVQKRAAKLEVNVKTLADVTAENTLEALTIQIEAILHPDAQLLPGSALDITDISSRFSSVGRLNYEHRLLSFDLDYRTEPPDSGDLVDFNHADVDWQTNPSTTLPEAKDTLSLD
ncbi:hypothetical protein [Aliamphritea ceti]|uniref:hypothetical protein n=1 Tax=Aliamphritea ceti TaxID=1524258 RepID=UPI0021C4A622|nr:hypothetical protein [Aliamphritea ceti]